MKTCFKKYSGNEGKEDWLKAIYLQDEERWITHTSLEDLNGGEIVEEYKETYRQEESDKYCFKDDDGKEHPMCSISNIFVEANYLSIKVFDDELKGHPVKVSNNDEMNKVINYLNNNKCEKE